MKQRVGALFAFRSQDQRAADKAAGRKRLAPVKVCWPSGASQHTTTSEPSTPHTTWLGKPESCTPLGTPL